jgi:glycosyltransferase involved in cell wall biosynthesis
MDRKLISVIIPVYNGEAYLRECIDSILNQSYRNFEVIVINDGSTDGTRDILERFYSDNTAITVINKKNGGVSAARNDGINASRGEYLMFLDADDEYLPDALKQMVMEMDDETDFLVCSYQKKWIKTHSQINKRQVLTRNDIYRDFIELNLKFNFIWANLYKADIIKKNKILFNEAVHFAEDYEFNLNYIKYLSGNIVLSDKIVYRYMISRSGTHEKVDLTAMNIEVILNFFGGKENTPQDIYDYFVSRYLKQCLNRNIGWHSPKKAANQVREAYREALVYADDGLLHNIFTDKEYSCIKADDYYELIHLQLKKYGMIKILLGKLRYRISSFVAHTLS